MEYDLFLKLMDVLSGWTNKKLNEVQREVYWKKIHRIPDIAFKEIISSLMENTPPSGKFPTPDQFNMSWHFWLQEHPKYKIKEYPQTECPECDGEGCFSVWYEAVILPAEQIAIATNEELKKNTSWCRKFLPCSQCQNWRRVFPTRGDNKPQRFYTRQEIIDKGWRFDDPYLERYLNIKRDAREKIKQTRDLNHLAEQAMSKPQGGM